MPVQLATLERDGGHKVSLGKAKPEEDQLDKDASKRRLMAHVKGKTKGTQACS